MNSAYARRAPHQGPQQPVHPSPNAALLIDFDNVTMGIRSDLGKELKVLLNSDVIRGKVAVQRAYADWRRYPQYIVPLAESSIDLIFAPAYGSSKKNATDLRMAIDAMELVFTRPEIGTFILLTGDSDFSSLVLKLKEYGKYVIGVGMRESSSDLLIQNCDEYYSYHSLSGLTRAGVGGESAEDPWVLVKKATEQMAAEDDVMRTDRLKQVMLDLDPAFDEKKLGYSKFSRFVSEAASKGLLRLRKAENGQYEILLPEVAEAAAEAGNGRGRGREAGRRDERREERKPEPERRREAERRPEAERKREKEPEARPAAARAEAGPAEVDSLEAAYGLLQQAVRALGGADGKAVRDGDVKRKMLEVAPSFDEGTLGFSKFTRFLRQAHDAEVIDLNRVNGGNYEVSLSAGAKPYAAPAPAAAAEEAPREAPRTEARTDAAPAREEPAAKPGVAAPRARRGMRGRAGAPEGPPPLLPGQVVQVGKKEEAAPAAEETPSAEETPAAEAAPAAEEKPRRTRRGGRGRKKKQAEAEQPAAEAAAEPEPKKEEKKPTKTRRGRGRGRKAASEADAAPEILPGQTVEVPAAAKSEEQPETEKSAKKKSTRTRKRGTKKAESAAPTIDAAALGLPRDESAVKAYLTNSYRGVGAKTADALWDAFGADVFSMLQANPDGVRDTLGAGRARAVLEQWSADYERRRNGAAPETEEAETAASGEKDADTGGGKSRSRGRRGGRGRSRRKTEKASA